MQSVLLLISKMQRRNNERKRTARKQFRVENLEQRLLLDGAGIEQPNNDLESTAQNVVAIDETPQLVSTFTNTNRGDPGGTGRLQNRLDTRRG